MAIVQGVALGSTGCADTRHSYVSYGICWACRLIGSGSRVLIIASAQIGEMGGRIDRKPGQHDE